MKSWINKILKWEKGKKSLSEWASLPTLTATHWMAGMQFFAQKLNFPLPLFYLENVMEPIKCVYWQLLWQGRTYPKYKASRSFTCTGRLRMCGALIFLCSWYTLMCWYQSQGFLYWPFNFWINFLLRMFYQSEISTNYIWFALWKFFINFTLGCDVLHFLIVVFWITSACS